MQLQSMGLMFRGFMRKVRGLIAIRDQLSEAEESGFSQTENSEVYAWDLPANLLIVT